MGRNLIKILIIVIVMVVIWVVTPARAQNSPQASGGPDAFGYTWDNSIAFNWVDATLGTSTGIANTDQLVGPISLPFDFKFYEHTYNQVYINPMGIVGFAPSVMNCCDHLPDPLDYAHNVIVLHDLPVTSIAGLYYLSGGDAPNRWWAAEWYQASRDDLGYHFTFEVVLWETGNIEFRYLEMVYGGNWQALAGIENDTGLDGLKYPGPFIANLGVLFTRPMPAARFSLSPEIGGSFISPGGTVGFLVLVTNLGDFGADTLDIFKWSGWLTALYKTDGLIPLNDSDLDNQPDTGLLLAGESISITIVVTAPAYARIGQFDQLTLAICSSLNTSECRTSIFQATVPAPFVQSFARYSGTNYQNSFFWPNGVINQSVSSVYYTPLATLPDGSIFQVTSLSHTQMGNIHITNLYYAYWDYLGNLVRPPTLLTHLGSTLTPDMPPGWWYGNYPPNISIGTDGRIGLAWIGDSGPVMGLARSSHVMYMVLTSDAAVIIAPTFITSTSFIPDTTTVSTANLAVTEDSYLITWQKRWTVDSQNFGEIWYAVQDRNGAQVVPPARLIDSTCSFNPNLTRLADDSLLLLLNHCGQFSYIHLSSTGILLSGPVALESTVSNVFDALQLPNDNLLLVWTADNQDKNVIRLLVLNPDLEVLRTPVDLIPSSYPIGNLSLTLAGNQVILTGGGGIHLYYALLDAFGQVITPPMAFVSVGVGNALSMWRQSSTSMTPLQISGRVLNLRGQAVLGASVRTQPTETMNELSDGDGDYAVYLGATGVYTLTTSRAGYGILPPRIAQSVSADLAGMDFVLPPEIDVVRNGGFESDNIAGWRAVRVASVVEATSAHTGGYGVTLRVPEEAQPGEYVLTQIVPISSSWGNPTLSWMVRLGSGSLPVDLWVQVEGDSQVVMETVTLNGEDWQHVWIDLSAFRGQIVMVKIGFDISKVASGLRQVYLDEISVGDSRAGVLYVYLPVMLTK